MVLDPRGGFVIFLIENVYGESAAVVTAHGFSQVRECNYCQLRNRHTAFTTNQT